MRFALLGPVQVHGDEAPVEIRGSLRRTLLAALLLSRGSVVSADRLAELIWGERPPAGVTTSLYNQVMRLRQALGEDAERIRAVAPGYLIHVEPGELDLDEFAGLCARARRAAAAADWPAAAGLYSDALALWRGEMLADVPALHEQAAIHQYEEDRLVALQGRIEADLNLGRQDELVGELRTLIGYHPLREAFHGQLMLALYRSGRQADALGVYRDLRRALIRELGVEPAAAVQELHHRILRSEPELRAPAAAAQSASAAPIAAQGVPRPRSVPRQLPVDSRLFTGRTAELEELVELAERAGEGAEAGMVVISAINGMGGIGKTALAVRAGHRVGAHFPDGQLFIDLRGYDAKLAPLPPEEALEYLLRSLGVPSPAIPADMDERAALYRSRLAGNRTLILLDNAASTAQVQPLLPGAAGCLVLITSRNRMMGLDDAHFFALDTLSPDEAIALLGKIAGAEPIGPCDPAARELVALCGYVPLAVRIVAARLRHNPRLTVPGLVEELREESGRLSQLRDEDRDLISVFESSFRSLPAAEARLFRLLGLLPGPDFDAYAAANLTADGLAATERRLDSLLGQNLLIQHTPGRYWLHDLLRTYARSLGIEQAEEQASLDRVFDYYEHTAVSASRLMDRRHRPPSSDRIQHPDPIRELPDYAAAVAWLGAERGNLVALMEHDCGPARRISLTASLTSFIRAETSKRQQLVWNTAALEAAEAAGQPADRAEALLNLARVYRTGGGFDVAVELLRRAIDGYRELDDKLGEANVQCEIGRFSALLDDYAAAAEGQERALAIYRGLGDRLGEADALYELSRVSSQVGRFEAAEKLADEALALFHELGRPLGEAQVRIVLADLRRRAGDFEEAVDLLRRSAAIFREARTRQDESNVLWTIGQIRLAQGRYDEAAELLEQTLVLCQEAGIQHGIGGTLGVLGTVRLAQGRYPEAAELLREALTVFQAIGHRNGIASSHQHLARVYHRTGDDTQAAALLDSATTLFEQAGDRVALAGTWNVRGELLLDTRGADAALEWFRKALEAAREVKDSALQAEALHGLAHCLAATDRPSALTAQREAVEIYRRLAVPELTPAEDFLRSLESPVRAVPDPTK